MLVLTIGKSLQNYWYAKNDAKLRGRLARFPSTFHRR